MKQKSETKIINIVRKYRKSKFHIMLISTALKDLTNIHVKLILKSIKYVKASKMYSSYVNINVHISVSK